MLENIIFFARERNIPIKFHIYGKSIGWGDEYITVMLKTVPEIWVSVKKNNERMRFYMWREDSGRHRWQVSVKSLLDELKGLMNGVEIRK